MPCLAKALCLGIGGAIEPKIIWSLGKYDGHLPAIFKVVRGGLAVLGLLITLALVFCVYPFGRH